MTLKAVTCRQQTTLNMLAILASAHFNAMLPFHVHSNHLPTKPAHADDRSEIDMNKRKTSGAGRTCLCMKSMHLQTQLFSFMFMVEDLRSKVASSQRDV